MRILESLVPMMQPTSFSGEFFLHLKVPCGSVDPLISGNTMGPPWFEMEAFLWMFMACDWNFGGFFVGWSVVFLSKTYGLIVGSLRYSSVFRIWGSVLRDPKTSHWTVRSRGRNLGEHEFVVTTWDLWRTSAEKDNAKRIVSLWSLCFSGV